MPRNQDGSGSDPGCSRLLTPEVVATICNAVRIGVALEGAARAAGIQRDTFWMWFRLGRKDDAQPVYADFCKAVDAALADFEVTAVGKVFGAEDWRAARAMLAMRFPDRYSEKRLLEVRGQVQHVPWIDPSKLVPEELESLRALLVKARPDSLDLPHGAAPAEDVLELEPGDIIEHEAA